MQLLTYFRRTLGHLWYLNDIAYSSVDNKRWNSRSRGEFPKKRLASEKDCKLLYWVWTQILQYCIYIRDIFFFVILRNQESKDGGWKSYAEGKEEGRMMKVDVRVGGKRRIGDAGRTGKWVRKRVRSKSIVKWKGSVRDNKEAMEEKEWTEDKKEHDSPALEQGGWEL